MIIIVDIGRENRKKELLANKEKARITKLANCVKAATDIEIVSPILKYEQKIKEIYKISFPINQECDIGNLELQDLIDLLELDDGEQIVIPYFKSTCYWISFRVMDKLHFIRYLLENNYLSNITIINIGKDTIFDINIGEQKYELRKINICDER